MSISSITSTSTIRRSTPVADASAPSARKIGSVPEVELDKVTQQPLPPRFPWLSRLSQQLDAAARQRSAFPAAPVLGDQLNHSA